MKVTRVEGGWEVNSLLHGTFKDKYSSRSYYLGKFHGTNKYNSGSIFNFNMGTFIGFNKYCLDNKTILSMDAAMPISGDKSGIEYKSWLIS